MFKITGKTSYKWPVTVQIPNDGGRFVKATFTAEFAFLDQDKISEVLENARTGRDNADICMAALVGWSDLADEGDGVFEYSDDNKSRLLNIPYARNAVLSAFTESITGDGARRKN